MSDLVVAVDYSAKPKYIGVVAAREHSIKSSDFLNRASWVKHIADLPRREKTVYLHRLPTRLSRIMDYLESTRYFLSIDNCNKYIELLRPVVVLVDDKLYNAITYPRKVKESRIRERHRKVLIMLADNVAYYTYWILEVRKKSIEELRRIVK